MPVYSPEISRITEALRANAEYIKPHPLDPSDEFRKRALQRFKDIAEKVKPIEKE